ncbi:DNA topoisomerase 1 [Teratosphaeria nubilosa]|uniref:DNA topoisomerase I n=1 Tax=Teratosphaeria nubilosa TaxID=161662 RepID=A0A6G1LHH5_9PEZI|nr:DNA topoisomerase 1 [Teratosphaeria nubilosa]
MSSDEDDVPLKAKSKETISKKDDAAMSNGTTNGHAKPGISLAMGPVEEMDVDKPETNGATTNGTSATKRRASSMANGKSYKDASDSDDDVPLQKKRKTKAVDSDSDDAPLVRKTAKPIQASAHQIGEESDDDVPLGEKLQKEKEKIEKKAEKAAQAIRRDEKKESKKKVAKKAESDDEDDVPLKKKAAPVKKEAKAKKVKKEESDDDAPLSKKPPGKKTAKVKKEEAASPVKNRKSKKQTEEDDEAEAEEDEYRWWEDPTKGDGTIKWKTLEHNGVVFPPDYEPLPKNVKMRYDGAPVELHPEAEEIAYAFGSMLHSTQNVENPVFQKNFFTDFKEMLDKTGHAKDRDGNRVKITSFEKCDFKPIYEHVDAERQAKKALPAAEKKRLKEERDKAEEPYMFCMWDGRKQKVGNFRVEPPGLFRGRGAHPKTGKFKKRVLPEQITINIGKEAMVPKPPDGHKWKEVKHDQEGTWLAMWQENINNAYKYVMLAANSDIKGQSDYKKFEKARELKKHIDKIRKDYNKELKSEVMAERQRATAVYLIDQFALRAGNEKGEDEADTVGCCSLKFEHVTLRPPSTVIFDFLGKDSIRFYDEVQVDPQVFKNLKLFKRAPKGEGDEIFDRLTTSGLNKHLSNYMPGLTAKVFRTYNASWTMSNLLKEMKDLNMPIPEKVKAYNDANRKVAILCNHKRTVAAGHDAGIEKMEERIKGLRYQQYRLKQQMLDLDPKLKKKKGEDFFALPDDTDEEWVKKHQQELVEEARTKIRKKFEKENEKLVADGEKEMKAKELEERMETANELEAKFKRENKKGGKIEAEPRQSIEKIENAIEKLDTRIATMNTQKEDKDNNKEVALGTSKINYIDPRLTVVFSKKFNVPIERFFSKTLREKFDWAIKSVDEDWEF